MYLFFLKITQLLDTNIKNDFFNIILCVSAFLKTSPLEFILMMMFSSIDYVTKKEITTTFLFPTR